MVRPFTWYKEARLVQYDLPFEDDISDLSMLLRENAEFKRKLDTSRLLQKHLSARLRKFFQDDDREGDFSWDAPRWLIRRGIIDHALFAVKQKERFIRNVRLVRSKEERKRVRDAVNRELSRVKYLLEAFGEYCDVVQGYFRLVSHHQLEEIDIEVELSTMEQLSSDLLSRVLLFVYLPERLRLAMSSRSLLRLVTVECSSLWVHVEFFTGRRNNRLQSRRLLTDARLAALLRRVNARQRTKYLKLEGAKGLQGTGLAPLRGSPVLERINMHVGDRIDFYMKGMLNLDLTLRIESQVAMEVLRSTIPHNLYHVKFPRRIGELLTSEEKHFIRDMRAARLQQVRQQNIKCTSCNSLAGYDIKTTTITLLESLMAPNPFVFGFPSNRCHWCAKHYCLLGTCPTRMLECGVCGDTSCSACDYVHTCKKCKETSCTECRAYATCTKCKGIFCSYCQEDDYYWHTCKNCKESICEPCSTQHPISFHQCFVCFDKYCARCQDMYCESCEECYCERCGTMSTCETCGESRCEACWPCMTCLEPA